MIAKYPGTCMFCRKPIAVGVDTYDLEIKKSYHEACKENQPPGPEAYTLADQLGFVPHDEASIRAAVADWHVRADWLLRNLPHADRGNSAGRLSAETSTRRQPDLFGEEKEIA